MDNAIQTTLSKGQSNLSLDYGMNPFSGSLSAANSDTTFSAITTGTSYEISDLGLGTEKVTNGVFAADTDWTKGTGWTISGGNATHATGTASNIEQADVLTVGEYYETTVKVSGRTVGSVKFSGASFSGAPALVADGTYTATYLAISTTLKLYAGATFDGSIDDVSVKPVSAMTFAVGSERVTDSACESGLPTMNGVSLTGFRAEMSHSVGNGRSASNCIKQLGNTTGAFMAHRFNDSSDCGLETGAYYTYSIWVNFASGQGITTVYLRYKNNAGDDVNIDSTTTTDGWVNLSGIVKDDDSQRIFYMYVEASNVNGIEVYWDSFSAKKLHNYQINNVISISGVDDEALSAEIATGSVGNTSYYIITATEASHFYTDCAVDDVFLGSEAVISQALDASNKVKLIPPVLAVPYRINSVDANGVCTLANADFSDLAANISSGNTASATLTNYDYTSGWLPGVDVNPTTIDSGTLTINEVYFITATETNNFYTDCATGEFFTSAGDETCDSNNTVVHITDTFVKCDGSQSAASDLESTGATIINNKGYKTTTIVDSIDAGTVTPLISTKPGVSISSPATDVQNIRSNGTDTAKLRVNTAADGVKITSWTIEQYR